MVKSGGITTPASLAGAGAHEPQSWRAQLLQGLLWSATAAFASVGSWAVVQHMGAIDGWAFVLGGAFTLALALTRRWLSYRVRALAFLLSVSGAAFYGLTLGGYLPNVFSAFSFVTVAATLLLGVRAGVGLVLFLTAGLIVVPGLHRAGILVRADDWARRVDSADAGNVGRVAMNFLALATSSVVAISFLLRRGERLLRERTRSFEQLAQEQAEKERIRNDLASSEAAYRKAAELEILGRLSGSMAHDFNNALLVIFASVDQLSRGELSPDLEEAVEDLRAAATQAASATRQLRAFGPQSAASVSLLMLGPAVRRLATLLARVLPSNIELSLDVDDGASIVADEGQIQRMLTNFVLNARDAMRDGGKVILRVSRVTASGNAYALLEVEDNGAGMSEEVRRRLFEPFFTTKGGAGTGLGLASARELVTAAGGRVTATSKLGVGSTLSVHWPLAEAATSAVRSSPAGAIDGSGVNVLVVDDDAQVRSLMVRGLKQFGFAVVEAPDGREGLLVARRHREPLHILCTDCIMPGIPLRDLVAGFRSSHPAGRVVVCSGNAPDESGFDPGAADAFMAKPFRIKELAQRLHGLAQADRGSASAEASALGSSDSEP